MRRTHALPLAIATLTISVVNGLFLPRGGHLDPFNLKIVCNSVEWDGQYLIPQIMGNGFDVAAISPMPFQAPSFYCDPVNQHLRCEFPDSRVPNQPKELVGSFSRTTMPAQHLTPLYFSAVGTEGMDTTKQLGFTAQGNLTHNGEQKWYACSDTKAKMPGQEAAVGMPMKAVNLLIGNQPFDKSCQPVWIMKEMR